MKNSETMKSQPELSREQIYVNNMAESIMFSQGIDPNGNNIIALFATGFEKNNRQAIIKWVIQTIEDMPVCPDELLPTLIDYFNEQLQETFKK